MCAGQDLAGCWGGLFPPLAFSLCNMVLGREKKKCGRNSCLVTDEFVIFMAKELGDCNVMIGPKYDRKLYSV